MRSKPDRQNGPSIRLLKEFSSQNSRLKFFNQNYKSS